MPTRARWPVVSSICLLIFSGAVSAEAPSVEALWKLLQAQQQQLDTLATELRTTRAALAEAVTKLEGTTASVLESNERIAEVDAKVEATADVIDQVGAGADGDALATTNVPQPITSVGAAGGRFGPSTSRASATSGSWAARTSIGGYGELHYNNLTDNATTHDRDADDLERVDFHRFVLFASHNFNEWLRFASEIEIEHSVAGDGKAGAVEIELAWLEADLNPRHHVRAGLDILPVGLINLTHEPNTFYGVERNPLETEIIPATWWEASAALWGELAPGWNYNAYVHSGLVIPTTGGSAFRPRSGRLMGAEADDQDVAFLARVLYSGTPGLELAVTFDYEADYTGTADAAEADAWLVETHLDWRHASGFGLRALYARWEFSSDRNAGLDPALVNADTLQGWYVEPAYRFSTAAWFPGEIGVFARYQQWDERNGLSGAAYRFEQFDGIVAGLNYWPHPQVVFKFDAQWQDADGPVDRELDGFNLGLGYQF